MKKLTMIFALVALAQPQAAMAGRPDFPAYHGQKDTPFNWCNWFAEAGLSKPYKIFCIQRG